MKKMSTLFSLTACLLASNAIAYPGSLNSYNGLSHSAVSHKIQNANNARSLHVIIVRYNYNMPSISILQQLYVGNNWSNDECTNSHLIREDELTPGMQTGGEYGLFFDAPFLPKNFTCGTIKITSGGKTVVDHYKLVVDQEGNYTDSIPHKRVLEIS